jgi:hypothetical protein
MNVKALWLLQASHQHKVPLLLKENFHRSICLYLTDTLLKTSHGQQEVELHK